MAKLPSDTVFGDGGSSASGRPIATYDGTGVGQGMRAAANAENAGAQAIAGGVSDLGKGISQGSIGVADYLKHQQDTALNLQEAQATAQYTSNKIELNAQREDETDQEKLAQFPTLHQKNLEDSASLIQDPAKRQLWTIQRQPDIAAQNKATDDRVFAVQKDAAFASAQTQLFDLQKKGALAKDDTERGAIITAGHDLIDHLENANYLTAEEATKKRQEFANGYAVSSFNSLPVSQRIALTRTPPVGKEQILDRIGGIENSTGDPAARSATSSAMGNFQFTNQTWLDTIAAHRPDLANKSVPELLDLRADPKLSREMAGYLLDDNAASLQKSGVTPNASNLYLAHFLGPAAAARVIKAPAGTPVADILDPNVINANRSVLAGKTTGTVSDWAGQKMGVIPPNAQGSALLKFMTPDQVTQVAQKASLDYHATSVDAERATKFATEQAKQVSDATENGVLKDIYSDKPTMTVRDIVNNDQLTREAKERMISAAGRALIDTKADKTYGPAFFDMYQKVHAADGDPNKITDPSVLYQHVGPNGDLTVAGVDKLYSEIQARKTPEGVAESEMRKQFLTNAKAQITGTDEGLHIKDPKGDALYLKFLAYALPTYDAQRKAGKTPVQLLSPDSPDYIGKVITAEGSGFKRPMDQWFGDVVQGSPVHAGAAPAFDVSKVKSLDDLVGAYRAGQVPKSVADQLAIDRGWAAKKPAAAPAQAPISSDNSAPASNLDAADAALKLTPQEKALYQRHLTNLNGPGGVDNPPDAQNPQGSRSTLYQTTVEHDGKFYVVPTVWNGKILVDRKPDGSFDGISKEGLNNVKREGWSKFPAYKSEAEAEARYQQMHKFMDADTADYFNRKQQASR